MMTEAQYQDLRRAIDDAAQNIDYAVGMAGADEELMAVHADLNLSLIHI